MSSGDEVRIVVRTTLDGRGLTEAGRQTNRLETETEQADHAMDDLQDSARRAGREAADAMDNAAESTEQAGESTGRLQDAMGSLGERGSGFLDGLSEHAGFVGEALGKLGPYGKAAAVAIGIAMAGAVAAVKLLQVSIEGSIERSNALGRMKAQMLLSPEDAKKYAKAAGKVYMDNWGESIEEASSYVRDAALYIMPTPAVMNAKIAPTVEAVAEKIAALAGTMDEDSKRVASAIQHMLLTGMAKSADEAFNLLHAGIAKGVNSADDLLDTFIEYSTEFRELGLNGAEAMGLLSQGLRNGARDSDTVADGLKELVLITKDLNNTNAQAGLKSLGLDAKALQTDLNAGGSKANAALALMLDKLRAVKDPAMQSAIAIQLFGTKAEDLQDAIFGLDLHTAAAGLGEIAGASDLAAAHMSGNAYSAIEAYQRKWEMLKADLGDKFLPTFEKVLAGVEKFADDALPVVIAMLDDLKETFADNHEELEQFGEIMGIVFGVGVEGAIGAIYLAIKLVIEAAGALGQAWQGAKIGFAAFVSAGLWGWGLLLKAAEFAFGWIPGIGPKLHKAEEDFQKFAASVNADLAKIVDKTVHIRVEYSQSGTIAPIAGSGSPNTGGHRLMASGGTGSGWVIAGDRGPELINLGGSARVYNQQETSRMIGGRSAGGGTTVVLQLRDTGRGTWTDALAAAINRGEIELVADGGTGAVRVA